jgi:hypothetical protein
MLLVKSVNTTRCLHNRVVAPRLRNSNWAINRYFAVSDTGEIFTYLGAIIFTIGTGSRWSIDVRDLDESILSF